MFKLKYKIPIIDRSIYEGSTHANIPLDKADPRFSEPLVNLEEAGIAFESYHAITDGSNPPFCKPIQGSSQKGWLRKSLIKMLLNANKFLTTYATEQIVIETYSSIA